MSIKYVYVMHFSKGYSKVGVSVNPYRRYYEYLAANKSYFGDLVKLEYLKFQTKSAAEGVERKILKEFKDHVKVFDENFSGYSEFFESTLPYETLVAELSKYEGCEDNNHYHPLVRCTTSRDKLPEDVLNIIRKSCPYLRTKPRFWSITVSSYLGNVLLFKGEYFKFPQSIKGELGRTLRMIKTIDDDTRYRLYESLLEAGAQFKYVRYDTKNAENFLKKYYETYNTGLPFIDAMLVNTKDKELHADLSEAYLTVLYHQEERLKLNFHNNPLDTHDHQCMIKWIRK